MARIGYVASIPRHPSKHAYPQFLGGAEELPDLLLHTLQHAFPERVRDVEAVQVLELWPAT